MRHGKVPDRHDEENEQQDASDRLALKKVDQTRRRVPPQAPTVGRRQRQQAHQPERHHGDGGGEDGLRHGPGSAFGHSVEDVGGEIEPAKPFVGPYIPKELQQDAPGEQDGDRPGQHT